LAVPGRARVATLLASSRADEYESGMAQITPLWRSDDLSVHRFHHPAEHEDQAYLAVSDVFSASFVEEGTFDLEVGEGRWRVGRGDVLRRHPGMKYTAGFDGEGFSDVCLTLTYLAANDDGFDVDHTWARAATPVARANNRLLYLQWGLRRAVEQGAPMVAEYCASEIFRPYEDDARASLFREHKLSWYAERVHAACETLRKSFDQEHTIGAVARSVGMSTFHFTRVFSELAGQPPHRFLADIRMREARAMLRAGRSVTETCFACGFNNLSHFSRSFARRYGVSPSRFAA
jgi:AraC family transcriptional regulator